MCLVGGGGIVLFLAFFIHVHMCGMWMLRYILQCHNDNICVLSVQFYCVILVFV